MHSFLQLLLFEKMDSFLLLLLFDDLDSFLQLLLFEEMDSYLQLYFSVLVIVTKNAAKKYRYYSR
jgi:hypothetical protein